MSLKNLLSNQAAIIRQISVSFSIQSCFVWKRIRNRVKGTGRSECIVLASLHSLFSLSPSRSQLQSQPYGIKAQIINQTNIRQSIPQYNILGRPAQVKSGQGNIKNKTLSFVHILIWFGLGDSVFRFDSQKFAYRQH